MGSTLPKTLLKAKAYKTLVGSNTRMQYISIHLNAPCFTLSITSFIMFVFLSPFLVVRGSRKYIRASPFN